MHNTKLVKKRVNPIESAELITRSSRNREISLKNDLCSFISIQPQKAHKITTTSTLNGCYPKTYYNQTDKNFFPLTYSVRKNASSSKPQSECCLRQFSKPSEDFDLASTLFSFGTGIKDKDLHEFKTNYLFKFAQSGEAYTNQIKYIQLLSTEKQTAFIDYYNKGKKYLDQTNGILFDRIKHNTPMDFSTWKQLISTTYELFNQMNIMLYSLFKELQGNKEKADKVIKRQNNELVAMAKSSDDFSPVSPSSALHHSQRILTKKQESIEENRQLKIIELQKEDNHKKIIIYRLESE